MISATGAASRRPSARASASLIGHLSMPARLPSCCSTSIRRKLARFAIPVRCADEHSYGSGGPPIHVAALGRFRGPHPGPHGFARSKVPRTADPRFQTVSAWAKGSRWAVQDSNLRPPACKAGALPAELTARAAMDGSSDRGYPRSGRPHRLAARSPPFQGGSAGSNPAGGIVPQPRMNAGAPGRTRVMHRRVRAPLVP